MLVGMDAHRDLSASSHSSYTPTPLNEVAQLSSAPLCTSGALLTLSRSGLTPAAFRPPPSSQLLYSLYRKKTTQTTAISLFLIGKHSLGTSAVMMIRQRSALKWEKQNASLHNGQKTRKRAYALQQQACFYLASLS